MVSWVHFLFYFELKFFFLDISEQIQTALANISDGVCHPLKVRVETILNSEKQTIVLYSVSNLIRFYQNIINHVIITKTLQSQISFK